MAQIFQKILFILGHEIGNVRFYSTYRRALKNQCKPYSELKQEQEKQLLRMIDYVYHTVPYYNSLFKKLNLVPEDIRSLNDLEKLPIITKATIKNNWEAFKPITLSTLNWNERNTGGSTGTPFKYRLDQFDRFLGVALWYRGWGYAGYELGDKVLFLGGTSIISTPKSNFIKTLNELTRNIKILSSFDMNEINMRSYVDLMNKFKPKYMYGYASSIYYFANWINDHHVEVHSPRGIFTTSEKLFPYMRKEIETIFNTAVYDTYGLNDGGVSAYECSQHLGLHVDTERAIMEVVDENGHQLKNGEGKILATSLYNYSMPFIRYDTGDLGYISDNLCHCGRKSIMLKEIIGRSADILLTPEGSPVHGWFFLYIFWEHCKGIREYQIIQEKIDRIVIKIVPDHDFDEKQLDDIVALIKTKSTNWNVVIKIVDKIDRTKAGKFKFIIKNIDVSNH